MLLAQTADPNSPLLSLPDGQQAGQWVEATNRWLADLPQMIDQLDVVAAGLLVPVGVLTLLYGFRVFKGVIVVYSAVLGAAGGWWLLSEGFGRSDLAWAGLLGGGVLVAVLAWPLMRGFIRVYGAVAGGLVGYAITQAVGDQRIMIVGVGAGALIGAILAAGVFRLTVVVITSMLGSHMAVVGIIALLYHVDQVADPLRRGFQQRSYLLPLVVAAPAIVGIFYQLHRSEKRDFDDDQKETSGTDQED